MIVFRRFVTSRSWKLIIGKYFKFARCILVAGSDYAILYNYTKYPFLYTKTLIALEHLYFVNVFVIGRYS